MFYPDHLPPSSQLSQLAAQRYAQLSAVQPVKRPARVPRLVSAVRAKLA